MLQHGIAFADQLHIAVFDTVMHHLDVMTGAVRADIRGARRAVFGLGRNLLENGRDQLVGFFLPAGHDRGPTQRAFLAAGNPGADEVQAVLGQLFRAADRILEKGVAAVDENIAFVEQRAQLFDDVIGAFTGLDHQQDTPRRFERGDEILDRIAGHQIPIRKILDHALGLLSRAVIDRDRVPAGFDVQGQIATHDGHADNADRLFAHDAAFADESADPI